MTDIGQVTGSTVEKNRDGPDKVRILQCVLSEDDDVQSVELMRPAGCDYNPVNGSLVLVLPAGNAWKIGIVCDDGIESTVEQGEYKIYSQSGGSIQASVYLNKDGEAVINDGTDYAVKYNELKAAFDQLKADHDDIVTIVNTHGHICAAPGSPTTLPTAPTPPYTAAPPGGVPGVQPSTADMTQSKSETVRIP